MAIKVKLREKAISGNRKSLYLDFYPAVPHPKTGEATRRQFLGLYLIGTAKTPTDKQHNKETLQLAELIRQKRDNNLNKPEIYTTFEKEQLRIKELGEISFIEYFKNLSNKRNTSTHDSWLSAGNYLISFTGGKLKFEELNEKFCEDFKFYLSNVASKRNKKVLLSVNSTVSYFNKFKAALKQAFKDGFLQTDLNSKIEPIKPEETHREFLTLDELNLLVKTDCGLPVLKKAALFSALTGLRFSDIQNLRWENLEHISGNGYFLKFKQQKTKGYEMMPISQQAYNLLGNAGTGRIMEDLRYSAWTNSHLSKWLLRAGISKEITFHCFRHTYATLQLSKGTDIYTVSKMLGHRELKTTQIYAKIIDQTKREAANRIKLDM